MDWIRGQSVHTRECTYIVNNTGLKQRSQSGHHTLNYISIKSVLVSSDFVKVLVRIEDRSILSSNKLKKNLVRVSNLVITLPVRALLENLLIHEYLRWQPKLITPTDQLVYNEEYAMWIHRNRGLIEYKAYLEVI